MCYKHSLPACSLYFNLIYGIFCYKMFIYHFPFIEFIEVTLVNKIIQVLGAQFYSTSSVHCIVHFPPQVISVHHHLSPYSLVYLPLPLLRSNHHIVVCVYEYFLYFFYFAQSLQPPPRPPPPDSLLSMMLPNISD